MVVFETANVSPRWRVLTGLLHWFHLDNVWQPAAGQSMSFVLTVV